MLLIGVGGSGRQSLARLSAFILEYKVFQIEVTRNYRQNDFHDDLKSLYKLTGLKNAKTVFLFTDTQIVLESFLEDINNLLTSGEVPNLFAPEDLEEIRGDLGAEMRKMGLDDSADFVYKTFIERVRNNLHVVLCMSPVGEPFRNRLRMYPGLVNCTTIDYFSAWPVDALLAVAEKFIDDVVFSAQDKAEDTRLRSALSNMFPVLHQSVVVESQRMFDELRRRNYVTPTSYLELVTGYKALLAEKTKELGDAADKLANGLFKIDDTREKVQKMSLDLEEAKKQVAQFQKDCDEYLIVIVQQKRDADDQQKAVSIRSEKIAVEAVACEELRSAAKADLDEALPALEAAVESLKSLNKNDITEIKSYSKPPPLVEVVMEAVMILRKGKPDWSEAKKQLGDPQFIKQLIEFDKDNMSEKVLKKIATYVSRPDFVPDNVGRVSGAAKSLCMWVCAMDVYGRIFKVVEPKRMALAEAESTLNSKQASLAEAKRKLQEVTDRVEQLQRAYEEKLKTKEDLRLKAEKTAIQLDRAGKLVTGLAGERSRWELSLQGYRESMGFLIGDCVMAAGFLSYLGPFTSIYRSDLVSKIWWPKIREQNVPCSPNFKMTHFLARPTDVRFWNIQGLPSDDFSTENGVIVTRGRRWPLMIDPQGQASKWIKNMERERKLKVIDMQQSDYMRTLENAIQFGTPVLLQNVGESLDPSLAPILSKAFVKQGGRLLLKLGDKEIEYNPEFRFYITTKISNPHYTPEISAKTSIVNFAVIQEGLRAQLLGIVVRRERPDLEEQKDALVVNIAAGKKKLVDLEDKILYLLNSAKGSLLDDATLVDTLNTSKITSAEVQEQLAVAEKTEVQIDQARQGYKPCANRATILFFVLNDIEKIDPMYQFALDAYISLFNISIDKAPKAANLATRIEAINECHTYAVYRYACRGLFEQHKLLFSFHMNAKIMEDSAKLSMPEFNFFLRGGQVLDRAAQHPNPAPQWISAAAWDNLTEMERLLPKFQGLANSMEQAVREWQTWYASSRPEVTPLPGEWEGSCNELQHMLFVRALRPDRVSFVSTSFIVNNLSQQFVEPPPLDMNAVLADSISRTPLIFVLSPGVDPTKMLLDLAERKNMSSRFHSLSLGQGQAPIAERMIAEGRKLGHWVFLANCHLSLSWMPALSKLVELLETEPPHPDFRLWLSSSPNPQFPISILQAGIKITTEPPKGIKANMKRLYATLTEQTFESCRASSKYKKLMFCLSFFHSVLIERRKFQMLGWNIIYGFNDADYEVSENLLRIYLDEYADTPWEALKYLIAGVNYGGHVTDDWDRRLLMTYIGDLFTDDVLDIDQYKVSDSQLYFVPQDGHLQSYRDYISGLPNVDSTEVFGQHPNADISSMLRETRTLLDTLVSLQPAVASAGGASREDKVFELAADMLSRLPQLIDYEATVKLLADDISPLSIVLLQEIQRYNHLLVVIRQSLVDLQKGIQGLVVMSTDLEQTFTCIFNSQVPPLWSKTFPSQKPLASWTRDLIERVAQFAQWAITGRPPLIFWLSGFTFPTGFLTAVLQTAARANRVPIDALSWEFPVNTLDDVNITEQPADGVYIRGLYLENAGWDRKGTCLIEPQPMELICAMPTIHFKPVENKKTARKGYYSCPCYYYPNRAGEGGASAWSFVVAVELKSGNAKPDHWVKRGTALLMSLDS
jgi:dynein heavy chain